MGRTVARTETIKKEKPVTGMVKKRPKTVPAAPCRRHKVFVSHSSKDEWVAKQMASEIEEVGAETFLDVKDIGVGDRFTDAIRDAINSADELVALLTPSAVKSHFVITEIGIAWARRIPIAGLLHGIKVDKVLHNSVIRSFLGDTNMQPLNEFPRYKENLMARVRKF